MSTKSYDEDIPTHVYVVVTLLILIFAIVNAFVYTPTPNIDISVSPITEDASRQVIPVYKYNRTASIEVAANVAEYAYLNNLPVTFFADFGIVRANEQIRSLMQYHTYITTGGEAHTIVQNTNFDLLMTEGDYNIQEGRLLQFMPWGFYVDHPTTTMEGIRASYFLNRKFVAVNGVGGPYHLETNDGRTLDIPIIPVNKVQNMQGLNFGEVRAIEIPFEQMQTIPMVFAVKDLPGTELTGIYKFANSWTQARNVKLYASTNYKKKLTTIKLRDANNPFNIALDTGLDIDKALQGDQELTPKTEHIDGINKHLLYVQGNNQTVQIFWK